jgi:APA family basic amino acid/polyamine antiporter
MTTLARKLRLTEYFTLGFGVMVGVGWLVVMDDWLARGGPLGGVLGFAIGGALLLPIGWVYGQWVMSLPDASGEVAYTARVFPQSVSFATGWTMLLAYFIVCPWEAVAVGKIAAYILPQMDTMELYRIAGQPVFLPRVVVGAALTLLLAWVNFRGIRLSATFLNWTTAALLGLFTLLAAFGAAKGSPANFAPLFSHTPLISTLLVLQVVPYFMTGFESVGKCAEESHPEFRAKHYFRAIALAIVVGAVFYVLAVASVAYVVPWESLAGQRFATAVAFERAFGSRWIVRFILVIAILGLVKCFNANFVAASRLLFALGRRGMVAPRLGYVHERNQTPSVAVAWVAVGTLAALLLGDAILIPVTEVGSVACAVGWFAACLSLLAIRNDAKARMIASVGTLAALAMVLMKVLPGVPGHFTWPEWVAMAAWAGLGGFLGVLAKRSRT